jgi:hypothetical protein
MRALIVFAMLLVAGCCSSSKALPDPGPTRAPQSWTGVADENKAYSFIQTEAGRLYVEFPDHNRQWPDDVRGRTVRVTGTLDVRHDQPVFIPDSGPSIQGIPMPAGTDLYKASARSVIENARWVAVEPATTQG